MDYCTLASYKQTVDILCFEKWGRLVRFVAQEDGQEHIGEPVDENQDGERKKSYLAVFNNW